MPAQPPCPDAGQLPQRRADRDHHDEAHDRPVGQDLERVMRAGDFARGDGHGGKAGDRPGHPQGGQDRAVGGSLRRHSSSIVPGGFDVQS